MSWETFNPGEVDFTPKPVEGGTYVLQLTGAYDNKYRPNQIDVAFMVTDDGPQKGKKVYMEIPDIEQFPWAGEIYARIVKALGAEVTPFSNPKDELNRVAQNGHSRLTGTVYIENFTRKDGSTGSKSKINTKSLRPAA